jgi:hypothetical protein
MCQNIVVLSVKMVASDDGTNIISTPVLGVGWALANKLQLMGIAECGDLQTLSLPQLQKEFGPKTGQSLYNYSRGIDHREIKLEQERKSVSAEINYGIRFTQVLVLDAILVYEICWISLDFIFHTGYSCANSSRQKSTTASDSLTN